LDSSDTFPETNRKSGQKEAQKEAGIVFPNAIRVSGAFALDSGATLKKNNN